MGRITRIKTTCWQDGIRVATAYAIEIFLCSKKVSIRSLDLAEIRFPKDCKKALLGMPFTPVVSIATDANKHISPREE